MRAGLRVLTGIGIIAATVAGSAQLVAQAPPDAARVQAEVARVVKAWDVPGVAVAVVKDGQVVMTGGYGVRRLGRPDPVTADTAFYTASVTKTFTIAALGVLADQGLIRLDDPVLKHLPDFGTADATLTSQLTIRDLATHRTGLPRADLIMFAGLQDRDVIARMKGLAPVAPLRSRFTYQNQMYLTLGEIIGRLGGGTWSDVVSSRLLTPLAMSQTSAQGLGHTQPSQPAAHPHARLNGAVTPVDLVPRTPYGGGGINSTARDLATWLRFLLGDGTANGAKIVGANVLAATQQPNTIVPPPYFAPDAVMAAYGLGWFLNDYHGHKVVQHGGNGEGWTTVLWMQPDAKLGVAVLTNMHNTMLPWAIAQSVADLYGGRTGRDWVAHFQRAEAQRDAAQAKATPNVTADPVDPAPWSGTWTSPTYGDLTITSGPDGTSLQYGPSLRATLRSVAGGGVAAVWSRSDVLAVLGPSLLRTAARGTETRLALTLGGDTVEFVKK